MDKTIGVCSLCGGDVVVPEIWMGVHPPKPRCVRCHARPISAAKAIPVIPMERPYEFEPKVWVSTRSRYRVTL